MIGIGRYELTGGFDGGVRRLDHDLCGGQVQTDQDVKVRNLAEWGIHLIFLAAPCYAGAAPQTTADGKKLDF